MLQSRYFYVTRAGAKRRTFVTIMLQFDYSSVTFTLQLCYNPVTWTPKATNPPDFTTDFLPMSIDKLHKFYLNFSTPEFTNYLQFTKNLHSRPRNYFLCNRTKFFKSDPDFLYTLHKNFLNFGACKHRPKCYT